MLKKTLFTMLLILLFSIGLVACSNNVGKSNNKDLVIADWGGVYTDAKKSTIEEFEKKFDVNIKIVTPSNVAKLQAMVDSGNVEWDVVNLEGMVTVGLANAGYLEKLDYNIIDTDGLEEEAIYEHSIVHDFITNVPTYNTNSISTGEHPRTFKDFWDTEKFPQARVLSKRAVGLLEAALLADGAEKESLYPLDVDRAFASLDKIKDHVKSWGDSTGHVVELLSENEAPMALTTVGRIVGAKEENVNVDYDATQGIILDDRLMVPKGAPNKDLAMEFINFSLQADQQAKFLSVYAAAPANKKALDLLSEEEIDKLGIDPEIVKNHVYVDNDWWFEHYEEVNERLLEWLIE